VIDHEPHQPFIRITDWQKDDHSQWMAAKSYCSICRKQVRLVFDTDERPDVKAHWEHIDARRSSGEPQLSD